MNKVEVLVQGYARENADGTVSASGTTSLITTNDKLILVDPGANKEMLLKSLDDRGLTVNNIDILFITHYHPDHWINVSLFPDHAVYDGGVIFKGDHESFYEEAIPGTNIKILQTPGHASEHVSPIVETEDGIVVIAEDVFWRMDGEQDISSKESLINFEDPFMQDFEALKESRKKVLEIADWIIPGHGEMFKNEYKKH